MLNLMHKYKCNVFTLSSINFHWKFWLHAALIIKYFYPIFIPLCSNNWYSGWKANAASIEGYVEHLIQILLLQVHENITLHGWRDFHILDTLCDFREFFTVKRNCYCKKDLQKNSFFKAFYKLLLLRLFYSSWAIFRVILLMHL